MQLAYYCKDWSLCIIKIYEIQCESLWKYSNCYNCVLFVIQLEKNVEYITLHDGVSEKSPVIYNLTGKMDEIIIRGTKRNMFIISYRKNINMEKGFAADISFGNIYSHGKIFDCFVTKTAKDVAVAVHYLPYNLEI